MSKHCVFCGDVVGERDWQYCGQRTVFVCDKKECNQAVAGDDRAAYEEAQEQLRNDWYGQ